MGVRVTKHQVVLSAPLSLRSSGTRAGHRAAQRLGAGLFPISRLPPPGCVCAHRVTRAHFPTTCVAFERKLAVQVPGMAGLGRRPRQTARESLRENAAPFPAPLRGERGEELPTPAARPRASPWDPSSVRVFTSQDGPPQGWFSELLTGASLRPASGASPAWPPHAAAPRSCLVFSNLLTHVLWVFFLPCGKETGLYRRKKNQNPLKLGQQ